MSDSSRYWNMVEEVMEDVKKRWDDEDDGPVPSDDALRKAVHHTLAVCEHEGRITLGRMDAP